MGADRGRHPVRQFGLNADDLCDPCRSRLTLHAARIEMEVADPNTMPALCEECARHDMLARRRGEGFDRIAAAWPHVQHELATKGVTYVPVQMLLPNGTMLATGATVRRADTDAGHAVRGGFSEMAVVRFEMKNLAMPISLIDSGVPVTTHDAQRKQSRDAYRRSVGR